MSTERAAGLLTFLFTDIEGSTRLWDDDPDPRTAAVLSAAVGTDPALVTPDVAELNRRLEDELGADTWAVCVGGGQGMSITETVAYAEAAISEALAALS